MYVFLLNFKHFLTHHQYSVHAITQFVENNMHKQDYGRIKNYDYDRYYRNIGRSDKAWERFRKIKRKLFFLATTNMRNAITIRRGMVILSRIIDLFIGGIINTETKEKSK